MVSKFWLTVLVLLLLAPVCLLAAKIIDDVQRYLDLQRRLRRSGRGE